MPVTIDERVVSRYDRTNPNMWWWHQPRAHTELDLVGALVVRALLGHDDWFVIADGLVDTSSFTDDTARVGWERLAAYHRDGIALDEALAHHYLDLVGWPACAEPQCIALLATVLAEHARWD